MPPYNPFERPWYADGSVVAGVWLVLGLISAVVCGMVASGKNRPPVLWGFIGLVAPVIGLIVIASLSREEKGWERDRDRRESDALRGVAREKMKPQPSGGPRPPRRRSVRRG